MNRKIPRLIIAGLSGDSGKTIASLSLTAALRRSGLAIAAFKKGPDYIDAAWLTRASGSVCRNLDTYMVGDDIVYRTFVTHAAKSDLAIIEGNRGLFDGHDVGGTHSTAQLARLLRSPVILVVDATKATRTVAALVKGCQAFDNNVNIAGVILNRVAGPRHQQIVSESIMTYCNLPVVGSVPKLREGDAVIPGRHLGLVPPTEHAAGSAYEALLLKIADEYLDVDRLQDIARSADELEVPALPEADRRDPVVNIGYFSDTAFTFYYPENLEALEKAGAELLPISSLDTASLPSVDGLYIGGGFPETHADRLVGNRSLMNSVKEAAERGMPIYAECGGLIYLCRSLTWQAENYSMAGVFPVDLVMSMKPAGHGYCEMIADRANPFFGVNESIRGHEFHYSGPAGSLPDADTCLQVNHGVGMGKRRDGLLFKSTMASYMHIHADGVPQWAPNFVKAARAFSASVDSRSTDATNAGIDRGTGRGGDSSGPRGELANAKARW